MIVNTRFSEKLQAFNGQNSPENRQWFFIAHDQLNNELIPGLADNPKGFGLVFFENRWWARRRPYHIMKLALVWANQRHFALEMAQLGALVEYHFADEPFGKLLRNAAATHAGLQAIEPAERELTQELDPLEYERKITLHPHRGWVSTRDQFAKAKTKSGSYLMDSFYRQVRKDSGILMEKNGDYVGGKVSFDVENRLPWIKGKDPVPPDFPRFVPDEITREVIETLRQDYADHPGKLDEQNIPATHDDAKRCWSHFLEHLLTLFGPYEDAMSIHSTGLFHSKISSLLNLTRLMPIQLVKDVENSSAPLNCREGFIRQIIGWREFVRHVHRETDGFRTIAPALKTPGDGGYKNWSKQAWKSGEHLPELDGGSNASYLEAHEPVPPAYWGKPSGLNCLDTVVASVWDEGWSHHITRLMVLSNLATLLDVSPRELTDWFWVAYSDAWDWVVEPNVLAMGTYGAGPLMTTKPYIAGSAYIDKMSDYCKGCAFDPKTTCPITRLYWAFLARHRNKLEGNPRLMMPYSSLKKRASAKIKEDEKIFEQVKETLARGDSLAPNEFFQ